MTILIVAQHDDAETAMVAAALERRGTPALWIDMADFPSLLTVTATSREAWNGMIRSAGGCLPFAEVTACLYRHPSRFVWPEAMTRTERRFAAGEAIAGVGGLLASLSCLYVNHPSRIADAEYKPLQIRTAEGCGLPVPATLITNDADAARAFARDVKGPVVYKPLAPGVVADQGRVRLIYTTLVDPGDFENAQIGLTSHMFQAFVDKWYDARVTVVGDRVFATAIHARTETARIDWRADYDALDYEPITVPAETRAAMLEYMRRIGLSMGTFDFMIDHDDRWWFAECNPQGRFGWIEESTELPIASAVADLLSQGDERGE